MTSRWLLRRRGFDRAIAAVLCVVLSPFIALCAYLVRREDGGPSFITVERVGRGGKPFKMWKIRTMRAETGDGRASGPSLALAEDPRVTRIGKRLRSYHLDEFPQLFNVVCGEMVLLGPRPEAPDYVDASDPLWARLLDVPPGIAGPTQLVTNRWEQHQLATGDREDVYLSTVLPVKLAVDEWYIQRSSPLLDLQILWSLAGRFTNRPARSLALRVTSEVTGTADIDWYDGARSAAPTDAPDAPQAARPMSHHADALTPGCEALVPSLEHRLPPHDER